MKGRAALFLAFRIAGPGKRGEGGGRRPRVRGTPARHIRGAIFGIALGLVPFVLVLVVADGMIRGISSRYLETWSWHFQATSIGPSTAAENDRAAAALRALPGVTAAWPEIRGPALAVHAGRSAPALIRGLDSGALEESGMKRYLKLLSGTRSLEGRQALVGSESAKKLGLAVGDSLVVMTGGADGGGGRTSILRVGGIVTAGYRDLDELWIFVPRMVADRILPQSARQDLIGIKVADPYRDPASDTRRFELALSSSLGKDHATVWAVRPWKELERNLFASFETTKALLLVIMCLSVLVAAANVSSALVMIVYERSQDIAILKAAGASPSFIALVFLLAGAATGLLGSILGVGLGALAAWKVNELIGGIEMILDGIASLAALAGGSGGQLPTIHLLNPAYYLERIPVRLDIGELGAVAGFAFLLSMLASTAPAIRAARLRPLEIMRKT